MLRSDTPEEHSCQSWPSDREMTCWMSEHAQRDRDKDWRLVCLCVCVYVYVVIAVVKKHVSLWYM